MKSFLLFFFTLLSSIAFSQDNIYKLNEKLKIDFIKLESVQSNAYVHEKMLTEVLYLRINDSITTVLEFYKEMNRSTVQEDFTISSSIFDEFVRKLKTLDIKRLNLRDQNIYDGKNYDLEFGNNNHAIRIRTNKPEENYLKLFLEMYPFRKNKKVKP